MVRVRFRASFDWSEHFLSTYSDPGLTNTLCIFVDLKEDRNCQQVWSRFYFGSKPYKKILSLWGFQAETVTEEQTARPKMTSKSTQNIRQTNIMSHTKLFYISNRC